ncbi:hypothetical protein E2F48_03890 [Arthrobacter crusticola]|uniref:Uncharacterized protein n=1 Tax=Arthrobacter crusticola TaxID=2547960 RepID=A0A4R5U3F6_9MICC|nr:hypothetical protein [Arthrobacter crusticola]TDK28231.1 hypothetical protein E2F48_03890 [Arthrobacter crusticola]
MRTQALPSPRIFNSHWTPAALQAAAEHHALIQTHTAYAAAVAALAGYAGRIDQARLRIMIARVTGSTEGTYWMAAALTVGHLAISFPQALTEHEASLLLQPLLAAERQAKSAARRAPPTRYSA